MADGELDDFFFFKKCIFNPLSDTVWIISKPTVVNRGDKSACGCGRRACQ